MSKAPRNTPPDSEFTGPVSSGPRPSGRKLFDSTMRRVVEPAMNLPVFAGWLDPSVAGLGVGAFKTRATTFPALQTPLREADLLIQVEGPAGPVLMHVEYQTDVDRTMARRMFIYRARIMEAHPGVPVKQFVVVFRHGRLSGHDDLADGFVLDLGVVYLRERDPGELLADPVLAPLAVLARGSPEQRERALGEAFGVILGSGHSQLSELHQAAASFAYLRLEAATIRRIREESLMSVEPIVEFYRDEDWAQTLRREGLEEGLEQGRGQGLEQGLEQGLAQGRERLLLALLRVRFGDRPELTAVASRLATWAEADAATVIETVSVVTELLVAEPPFRG